MFIFYLFIYFCLFAFSRAAPAAYGGSQARGQIGAAAAGRSHGNARRYEHVSVTYATAHGNARSLTH